MFGFLKRDYICGFHIWMETVMFDTQIVNVCQVLNKVWQRKENDFITNSVQYTRTACWLERRTRDRNVARSNPGRSGGKFFFSRVNLVCWLLFGVRSTPVLPQWHVKDPGHSAKSAGDRLHLNTHTPLTQRSRSGLNMPLSRHSVGTYPETSSHTTYQGTFGHSCLSSVSHCGLILT